MDEATKQKIHASIASLVDDWFLLRLPLFIAFILLTSTRGVDNHLRSHLFSVCFAVCHVQSVYRFAQNALFYTDHSDHWRSVCTALMRAKWQWNNSFSSPDLASRIRWRRLNGQNERVKEKSAIDGIRKCETQLWRTAMVERLLLLAFLLCARRRCGLNKYRWRRLWFARHEIHLNASLFNSYQAIVVDVFQIPVEYNQYYFKDFLSIFSTSK